MICVTLRGFGSGGAGELFLSASINVVWLPVTEPGTGTGTLFVPVLPKSGELTGEGIYSVDAHKNSPAHCSGLFSCALGHNRHFIGTYLELQLGSLNYRGIVENGGAGVNIHALITYGGEAGSELCIREW